jgi:hypothetical protein
MAKDGKKMWEKLERYAKMKKWLERDTNGNDILKYQNNGKDEKWSQNMEKMERDAKICNYRHVTKCDKNYKKSKKLNKILVPWSATSWG